MPAPRPKSFKSSLYLSVQGCVHGMFIETGLFTQSPPTHFVIRHEQLVAQR